MLEASADFFETPCCNAAQAHRMMLTVNPNPGSNLLNTSGSTALLAVSWVVAAFAACVAGRTPFLQFPPHCRNNLGALIRDVSCFLHIVHEIKE